MEEQEKKDNQQQEQQIKTDTKRRTALLRYIGIMFGVAFVLVAASLLIQTRNSQTTISKLNETNSSVLSKAEELQTENRKLADEIEALTAERDALQTELENEKELVDKMLADTESESQAKERAHRDELEELQTTLDKTQQAYEALTAAMGTEAFEGNVTYSKAMETLRQLNGYLLENGRAAYEKLLTK